MPRRLSILAIFGVTGLNEYLCGTCNNTGLSPICEFCGGKTIQVKGDF